MAMETSYNVYALRQALLRDFKRYDGTPIGAAELAQISVALPVRYAPPGAAETECRELTLMGYLEPLPGWGGVYLRITQKGLEQLAPEFPHDVFVWGPSAVRR